MKKPGILLLAVLLLAGCGQAKTNNTGTTPAEKATENTPEKVVKAPAAIDTTFTFEACETNKLPAGWTQSFTGKGTGTEWKVLDDEGNKVLAQVSMDNPSYHFNVITYDGYELKDMELTVRLKGVLGKEDRGGGFVWRFTDKDNYYVVRANPLENNVVLYKVVKGKRSDLPLVGKGRTYGMKVPPLGSQWNTLKLRVEGNTFTVWLNGKELYKVQDDTFTNAGKIGLWTKADAYTYFDDYHVKELK